MKNISTPRLSDALREDLRNYIDDYYDRIVIEEPEVRLLCRQTYPRSQDASVFSSPSMGRSYNTSVPQSVAKEKKSKAELEELGVVLQQMDTGFSETLLKLIDETGKKDSDIYKKANLSKQHFSKIRNNPEYRPTKPTALALAIALELDLERTKDLIGRAGYALTGSSKFDLIIRYFIEKHIFDVVQINLALYEYDQPLLGS